MNDTFYWIRTWSPYAGWQTYYEGWKSADGQAAIQNWHDHVQAGAYVVADTIDNSQGASWQREVWQSYTPYTVPGRPLDVGSGTPPPLPPAVEAPPPPKAGQGWTELPQGHSILIRANYYYAAVAAVKSNHSAAEIRGVVAPYGVQIIDLQDPYTAPWLAPADSGYRNMGMTVFTPKDGGELPWAAPGILSLADGSHIVRAWAAPKSKTQPAAPPSGAATSSAGGLVLGGLVLAGVGLATVLGYRALHRQRRAG